jgi:HAD superfamily hydrolase (TIGR01450 family)
LSKPLERLAEAGGFMLDLDGCLVLRNGSDETGGRTLPGAAELIEELRARKLPFVCCTNAAGQAPAGYAAAMRALGLPIEDRELITPAVVAAEHLSRKYPRSTVMVLGGEGVTLPLTSSGIAVVGPEAGARADVVLVGPTSELTGRAIQGAADAIRGGAAFLVTSYVPLIAKQSGSVASVSAAIGAGLAHVSGASPSVLGKPSPIVMDAVCARLGVAASEVVVVGDDPALEIELGRRVGAVTVLVLSGIAGPGDVQSLPQERRPDYVFSGVEELLELLRR